MGEKVLKYDVAENRVYVLRENVARSTSPYMDEARATRGGTSCDDDENARLGSWTVLTRVKRSANRIAVRHQQFQTAQTQT
jgi:hypothetical protein